MAAYLFLYSEGEKLLDLVVSPIWRHFDFGEKLGAHSLGHREYVLARKLAYIWLTNRIITHVDYSHNK